MHWKKTLMKSEDIKWKGLHAENIAGKLDIHLKIPLTNWIEAQAKASFAAGMLTMLQFHVQKQTEKSSIEVADLIKLFNDCGLPDIANRFKEAQHGG